MQISFASGECLGGGSEINSGLFHKPNIPSLPGPITTLGLSILTLKFFLVELISNFSAFHLLSP